MSAALARLRSLVGASTALWAGQAGVRVEPGRWAAISGARSVDYNVVLCHGASGGTALPVSLREIAASGAPALVMVAGEALGEVQQLIEAGWVCIGAVPFMTHGLDRRASGPADPRVRRLDSDQLQAPRALIDGVFGIGPELALTALPPDAAAMPGQSVWGVLGEGGELVSCLAAVRVEEAVVIWSMATAPEARRHGHGARLLNAVLADAARSGARCSLLHASTDGEPFYRSAGFQELERWQLWSRPRWVLGRA